MTMIEEYLAETVQIVEKLDPSDILNVINLLYAVRAQQGRVFVLGVGGSASTASHFVNDLRKLCDVEAYAWSDGVSELTARTNDDGWKSAMVGWLEISRVKPNDCVFVFSVGGGATGVSGCVCEALEYAKGRHSKVAGIVGRDGGMTAEVAQACVVIPALFGNRVTPHTEGLASVVAHCIVSHPTLQRGTTKW